MAAAFNAPIYCNSAAGEGGPYGMALLAAYLGEQNSLEQFLDGIFKGNGAEVKPDKKTVEGFNKYMQEYKEGLKCLKN